MDSAGYAALALIVLVPALAVAVRIVRRPFDGVCLWVMLLPITKTVTTLAGYPVGTGPVALRKVTLGDAVLLLVVIAALAQSTRAADSGRDPQARRIVALLGGFCLVSLLSALLNAVGPESLVDVATYVWLWVSLIIVCRLLADRLQERRILSALRVAGALACVAGAAGTWLLWSGSADNLLVQGGRVTGLFEAPNQLQSFMVVAIPFLCVTAFDAATPRRTRLVHGALITFGFVSVLASGTRAGILWTALAIWLMLALAAPRAGVLAACLLLITATAAVRVVEEHQADLPFGIRRALSLVDTESLELRDLSHGRADQLIAWQTVFGEHPWLGVGPDQFRYSIPRLVLGGKAQEMHNTYLAVLAEAGLAGGVMIFVLLADALARAAAFLRRAVRRRGPEELALARALLVSYVCLLLYGTVNHGLRQRYLWLVIALIVSAPHVYRAAPGGTGAGAPRRIRLRPAAAIAPYVNARSTA